MKTEVTFFKQDNKWYADIPNHTLEENEMVMGADIALEYLSESIYNTLILNLSDEDTYDYLLVFNMSEHDDDGAYYTASGPLCYRFIDDFYKSENDEIINSIWICNVTHDVFGEHPNRIYLTDIKKW